MNCTPSGPPFAVMPTSGSADHLAAVPGNQVQFHAQSTYVYPAGCATPLVIPVFTPAWSVSDPVNVTISSAVDNTNGLATCVGATTGSVTVTAKNGTGAGAVTATATMTCR